MSIDKTGLTTVFEANRGALLSFLTSRLRSATKAEDVLQDVWVKIASGRPSGPVADPLSYLYRTCENAARDLIRSEARRSAREQSWAEDMNGDDWEPVDNATPEYVAIQKDFLREVEESLDDLPARTRQIFWDFRVNGVPQKTISKDLGISVSAVEKHLQRAYRLIVEIRRKISAERN